MPNYLDFEEPLAEIDGKIEELRHQLDQGELDVTEEVAKLELRAEKLLEQTYAKLTPWQKTLVARHQDRPHMIDYLGALITDFTPLAGDRAFAEDKAVVGGMGRFNGRSVMVIGTEKGHDTASRVAHNFGMARPEGYRKAIRLMKLADQFGLPVITFIDTAGAYPGVDAEARGPSRSDRAFDRSVYGDQGSDGECHHRRRRFRRRHGDRGGKLGDHARTRDIFRDLAGRLRIHFMARW